MSNKSCTLGCPLPIYSVLTASKLPQGKDLRKDLHSTLHERVSSYRPSITQAHFQQSAGGLALYPVTALLKASANACPESPSAAV